MTTRTDRLLREIEAGAVDDETPIVDLLRKVISVGGQMGSSELRDWAAHELHGFEHGSIPHYRTITAPLMLKNDGGWSKPLSRLDLPVFARRIVPERPTLTMGIAEIERASVYDSPNGYVELTLNRGQDVLAQARRSNFSRWEHVAEIYWKVSTDTFRDIVDHVRTTLTVLVAEIRANTSAGTVAPPAAVATNAIHFAITGSRNTITFTAPQDGSTVAIAQSDQASRSWVRIAGAVLLGLVAIAGVIFALMETQGWTFG